MFVNLCPCVCVMKDDVKTLRLLSSRWQFALDVSRCISEKVLLREAYGNDVFQQSAEMSARGEQLVRS